MSFELAAIERVGGSLLGQKDDSLERIDLTHLIRPVQGVDDAANDDVSLADLDVPFRGLQADHELVFLGRHDGAAGEEGLNPAGRRLGLDRYRRAIRSFH